jgi:uncharacterized paraquat-inducible protein A
LTAGNITASLSDDFASVKPTISLNLTLVSLSSISSVINLTSEGSTPFTCIVLVASVVFDFLLLGSVATLRVDDDDGVGPALTDMSHLLETTTFGFLVLLVIGLGGG